MKNYNHAQDKKWQDAWERAKIFNADDSSDKEKFYCLAEFPYPSGIGLHVGHTRSYSALDIIARKRRMEGYNVMYPIGWDAFGLPTENYAIKTGRKPQEITKENTDTFRRQLKSLGFSFDWTREVNTTDPKYYKWTQWMFLEFFKAGLAYKKKMAINWCVDCKIGLANEEVVNGACERCGGEVEKREKDQWMIAITKYADRLIDDLEGLDYLDKIKKQQVDWIGRSEGASVMFKVDASEEITEVFTTRPDTLFGATYMVLAPEHELVSRIVSDEQQSEVAKYVKISSKKTDIERGDAEREKTGVFTGAFAVNPATGKKIPVWVADYVLMGYGTGAIMAVPAHDERDFAFAKKFKLDIVQVVAPPTISTPAGVVDQVAGKLVNEILPDAECYTGDGKLVNSDFLDGVSTNDAKQKMILWLEKSGVGKGKTNFRLRDWVFSRQRYWGEPIPLIDCQKCGWVAVPESQLPVVLPEVEKYEPTDTGESPLATITDWVNTECPKCGGEAKRETDTMPNWAGSSWYFLRYIDPHNENAFADPNKLKYWMPVDWYNGGMEHTTLHLLYSRFWNKFLADRGHVPVSEPYKKRTSHGLILAEDGSKMSKSKGNSQSPDEIVSKFGADTLRVYEMFIGPFGEPTPWSDNGLVGVKKFLDKSARLSEIVGEVESAVVTKSLHKMIKKVGEDIEAMRFNTAVSQMMIFVNDVTSEGALTKDTLERYIQVLNVFAPHLCEEMWQELGHKTFVASEIWPEYNSSLAKDEFVTIGVQINGKVRGQVKIASDASEENARKLVLGDENVAKYLDGKEVKKFIYVQGRIISIVLAP